jgi:hypothetical protein
MIYAGLVPTPPPSPALATEGREPEGFKLDFLLRHFRRLQLVEPA